MKIKINTEEEALDAVSKLWPGIKWEYATKVPINRFERWIAFAPIVATMALIGTSDAALHPMKEFKRHGE